MGTEFFVRAITYVICFAGSWYAMSAVNYERILKKGYIPQAQLLYFMLVAALAYLSGSFVLAFVNFAV